YQFKTVDGKLQIIDQEGKEVYAQKAREQKEDERLDSLWSSLVTTDNLKVRKEFITQLADFLEDGLERTDYQMEKSRLRLRALEKLQSLSETDPNKAIKLMRPNIEENSEIAINLSTSLGRVVKHAVYGLGTNSLPDWESSQAEDDAFQEIELCLKIVNLQYVKAIDDMLRNVDNRVGAVSSWVDGLTNLIVKRELITAQRPNMSARFEKLMDESVSQYFVQLDRYGQSDRYTASGLRDHLRLINVHPLVNTYLETLPNMKSWLKKPAEELHDPKLQSEILPRLIENILQHKNDYPLNLDTQVFRMTDKYQTSSESFALFELIMSEGHGQPPAVIEQVRAKFLANLIERSESADGRLILAREWFNRPKTIDYLVNLLNRDPLMLDQQEGLQENAARTKYYVTSLLCSLYADPASHFYILQALRRQTNLATALSNMAQSKTPEDQSSMVETAIKFDQKSRRLANAYLPAINQEIDFGQNYLERCRQQEILTPEETLFLDNVLRLNQVEGRELSKDEQKDILEQAKKLGLLFTYDGKAITPYINSSISGRIPSNSLSTNVTGLKPLISVDRSDEGKVVGYHFPIHSFYSKDPQEPRGISVDSSFTLEIDRMESVNEIVLSNNGKVVMHQVGNDDLYGQTETRAINHIYVWGLDGQIIIDNLSQSVGNVSSSFDFSLEIKNPPCSEAAYLISGVCLKSKDQKIILYDSTQHPVILTMNNVAFARGLREVSFTGAQLAQTAELMANQYPIEKRTEQQKAELAEVFTNIYPDAPALTKDDREGRVGEPLIFLPVDILVNDPEIKSLKVHKFNGSKYGVVETPVLAKKDLAFVGGATEFAQLDCQGTLRVDRSASVYIKDGNIKNLSVNGGVVVVSEQMLLNGKIQKMEFTADYEKTNSLIVVDDVGSVVLTRRFVSGIFTSDEFKAKYEEWKGESATLDKNIIIEAAYQSVKNDQTLRDSFFSPDAVDIVHEGEAHIIVKRKEFKTSSVSWNGWNKLFSTCSEKAQTQLKNPIGYQMDLLSIDYNPDYYKLPILEVGTDNVELKISRLYLVEKTIKNEWSTSPRKKQSINFSDQVAIDYLSINGTQTRLDNLPRGLKIIDVSADEGNLEGELTLNETRLVQTMQERNITEFTIVIPGNGKFTIEKAQSTTYENPDAYTISLRDGEIVVEAKSIVVQPVELVLPPVEPVEAPPTPKTGFARLKRWISCKISGIGTKR
ncbi:MAG: hypothetical protein COS76_01980, partial [Candidatus Portnoybacteria bacterium CG06_land_8_20_14_3_00_39_12]